MSQEALEGYSNKVKHFARNPINYGAVTPEEAQKEGGTLFVGTYGSEESGEAVSFYLVIDNERQSIIRAKFESYGSLVARAVYDMLCMTLRTKTMQDIKKIDYFGLERFVRDNPAEEALPESDRYLITFAVDAIHHVAKRYLNEEEEHDKSKIVCQCARVTLGTIEEAIRLHDLTTVEAITDYTKAGAFCQSCIDENSGFEKRDIYLVDILKRVRKEMEEEAAQNALPDEPFEALDTPQQIAYVNKIIDEGIRRFLIMDGGDLEILDIRKNGEHIDIYIRYLGACSGCASSATGTLFAIENAIKEKLGPNVRVLPI